MAESSAPLDVGLELEHAIGFTGTSKCPLHFHPAGQEMAYASGACVVIANVTDPHKQAFLRGHDDVVGAREHQRGHGGVHSVPAEQRSR